MPIFDYKCTQCGEIRKDEIKEVKECNSCDWKGEMERQFPSEPALPQFKGTGFYNTDYKNK